MKPLYRHVNGAWTPVRRTTKPHLKLAVDGSVQLKRPAVAGRIHTPESMTRLIRLHYGTVKAFARRWGLPLQAVHSALTPYGAKRGGQIRGVRVLLGMPSSPTKRAGHMAYLKAASQQPQGARS